MSGNIAPAHLDEGADNDTQANAKMLLKKGGKQQFAYDYIKHKITRNIYKPQHPLYETDLSAEMNDVSRTPIRDALKALMHEGLVESVPGKGMIVADIRFEDILEIFDIRILLETYATRLFTQHASRQDIEELKVLFHKHKESFESGDYVKAVEFDNEFHIHIAKGSGNGRIYTLCKNHVDLVLRASFRSAADYDRTKLSYEEHCKIYNAVINKDADLAAQELQEHFVGLRSYLAYAKVNYRPHLW